MYHIVYKTTNKLNGKIYVGYHKCDDLNDEYIGSGSLLKRAIEKYGSDNFIREIVATFDNSVDAFALEAEIVNSDFVARDDTYNLKVGGRGGFDFINANGMTNNSGQNVLANNTFHEYIKNDVSAREEWGKSISEGLRNMSDAKKKEWADKSRKHCVETESHLRLQTPEATIKRQKTFKETEHQKGDTNSQYGTMWIYSLELKQNKKIPKDAPIPDGWCVGRKMKF